jgi:hypothetical protein
MTYAVIYEDAAGELDRREVAADDDLKSAVIDFILTLPPLSAGDAIRITTRNENFE